jgi:hypothetical protein
MKEKLSDIHTNIINVFKSDKNTIFILALMIAILIATNLKSCHSKKVEEQKERQNLEAMKNELTVEKNKNGKLQTSIIAYDGDLKNLKIYSEELQKEVESLKGRKPKVISIVKTEYIQKEPIITNNNLNSLGDGNYDLTWEYTDTTKSITGTSGFNARFINDEISITPGKTIISKLNVNMDFTVGVVKNKKTGLTEIFVTPHDSSIVVRELKGAILDSPKDKKFSLGLQAGVGLVPNRGGLSMGPYIGVGVSYSLIKF